MVALLTIYCIICIIFLILTWSNEIDFIAMTIGLCFLVFLFGCCFGLWNFERSITMTLSGKLISADTTSYGGGGLIIGAILCFFILLLIIPSARFLLTPPVVVLAGVAVFSVWLYRRIFVAKIKDVRPDGLP